MWRPSPRNGRTLTFCYSDFERSTGHIFCERSRAASRTLTRRKQQGRFAPDESDRLLRAARLFGRALELFEGNRDAATEWLFRAQPALGSARPVDVARTELRAREVENLIGRLEHGVFS